MGCEIVPATREHALYIAAHMAQADVDEVQATGGDTPIEAMLGSFLVSRDPRTVLGDGVPVVMFGVLPPTILSGTAAPWMLGTDELPKHARWFLRESKHVVAEWLDEYKALANYSDVRHTVANRWLSWLGFRFSEPAPFGPTGSLCMRFEMGG